MRIKKFRGWTVLMVALGVICLSSQSAFAVMVANDDTGATNEDTVLNVGGVGVLSNDSWQGNASVISYENPSTGSDRYSKWYW